MSASEWVDLLVEPRSIRDIFVTPPDLDECSLFYCHIDERGTSVTLGFDTRKVPDSSPSDGAEGNVNAFEFFITFTTVVDLRISGWGGSVAKSVTVSRSGDDTGIAVYVESPTERLSFRAEAARISRARTYLASSSE